MQQGQTEESQRLRCKSKRTWVLQHRAKRAMKKRRLGGSGGGKRPRGAGSGAQEEPAGLPGLPAGLGQEKSRVTRAEGGGGGRGKERTVPGLRRNAELTTTGESATGAARPSAA